jgi:hypothetical protein
LTLTPRAWLVLAVLAGALAATVGATLAPARHTAPMLVPNVSQSAPDVDCWDGPSCAATRAGYVVTDPAIPTR